VEVIKIAQTSKDLTHKRSTQHAATSSVQKQDLGAVPSIEEHPPSPSSSSRLKASLTTNGSLDLRLDKPGLKESFVMTTSHISQPVTKHKPNQLTDFTKTANAKNERFDVDHMQSKASIDLKKVQIISPTKKAVHVEVDQLLDNIGSSDVFNKKTLKQIDLPNSTKTPAQKDDEWAPDEDFKPNKPQRTSKSSPKKGPRAHREVYKLRKAMRGSFVNNENDLCCRIRDGRFIVFHADPQYSEIPELSTFLSNIQTINVSPC